MKSIKTDMIDFKELSYLFTLFFAVLGCNHKEMPEEILESTFIEYQYEINENEVADINPKTYLKSKINQL